MQSKLSRTKSGFDASIVQRNTCILARRNQQKRLTLSCREDSQTWSEKNGPRLNELRSAKLAILSAVLTSEVQLRYDKKKQVNESKVRVNLSRSMVKRWRLLETRECFGGGRVSDEFSYKMMGQLCEVARASLIM